MFDALIKPKFHGKWFIFPFVFFIHLWVFMYPFKCVCIYFCFCGFLFPFSKSLVRLTKTRVEMVKKKKSSVCKYLKNDIADLIKNNLDYNAYGRVIFYFDDFHNILWVGIWEDHSLFFLCSFLGFFLSFSICLTFGRYREFI